MLNAGFLSKLRQRLPALTIVFCVSQPFLDVLTYWQTKLKISGYYVLSLRVLLLLAVLCSGFLLSRRKKLYFAAAAAMIVYLAAHVVTCASDGYLNPILDLSDQLRLLLIYASTICFITFLRENEAVFEAIKRGFVLSLTMILAVEILSTVTGSDPNTYHEKGIGVLGWFLWGNTQSAILSLMTPIVIAWAAQRCGKKLLPLAAVSLLCFGMLFFCGTRLAFGMIAFGPAFAFCIVLTDRNRMRQALTVACAAFVFFALFPLSPMLRNQKGLEENERIKQDRIAEAVAPFGVSADARTTDNPDALAAAYHFNLQGMVDRFGLARVAEEYHNSLEASEIFERRSIMLKFCEMEMKTKPLSAKLFGLELADLRQHTQRYAFYDEIWKEETEIYEPENDFHAVYYLNGLVGLLALAAFLLFFGVRMLLAMVRNPKQAFTMDSAAFSASYLIILVNSVFASSVLRRINASVFLSIILAVMWYLSGKTGRNDTEMKEIRHAD